MSAGPARLQGRQFHYQPVASHVHPFLVELWDAVRAESGGRVDITVHANNDGLKDSHAQLIDRVRHGDIELYAVMGSLLGELSPVFEIQGRTSNTSVLFLPPSSNSNVATCVFGVSWSSSNR